jgi:hypothetical protein
MNCPTALQVYNKMYSTTYKKIKRQSLDVLQLHFQCTLDINYELNAIKLKIFDSRRTANWSENKFQSSLGDFVSKYKVANERVFSDKLSLDYHPISTS